MIDIDKGRGHPYSSADWFSSSTGDCDDYWPLVAACAQVERCPSCPGQRQRTVNGTVEHRWSFSVFGVGVDGLNGRVADAMMTSRVMNDEDDLSTWTHLVGVHDQSRREVQLSVNGKLESTVVYGTGSFTGAFDATGPLYVGAARYTPPGGSTLLVDRWHGDIDDVGLYQGVLTSVAVEQIFSEESTTATAAVG